jgi:hypothetical protein
MNRAADFTDFDFMNTLGRESLAGFTSVLQTIPIDGSSGKRREISVPPEFRALSPGFRSCATGLRNHFPALRAIVVDPSLSLGAVLDSRGSMDSLRFQKRLTKTAVACCFIAVVQSVAHARSRPLRSLGCCACCQASPARFRGGLRCIPGYLPNNREPHYVRLTENVNRIARAPLLASQPQRWSARRLFGGAGCPSMRKTHPAPPKKLRAKAAEERAAA